MNNEVNFFKGRIISQYKDLYKIAMTNEELTGEASGKFRFSATSPASFPAVGDYVMVDRESDSAENGIIHELLPRKSLLARKAAGNEKITQIIAANIDYIFICMSLNNDFNLRRIERYLAIAWDSGAVPLIVLTKADLADNLSEKLQEVEEVAPGVDVIITSMENDDDHLQVLKYIKEGKTGAFVDSSGVGKSTLINKVLGKDVIKTSEIRSDDKGRHTTTRRDLFILPNGGVVIDTPGMRELGIDQADLSRSFEDIEALATECRFKDCSHKSEPGCALRKGIEDSTISEERLESYLKLKKEAGYEGLNSKEIEKRKLKVCLQNLGELKTPEIL